MWVMLAFLALAHMDDARPFIALRACPSQFYLGRVLGLLGYRLLGSWAWLGWVRRVDIILTCTCSPS